MFSRFDIDDQNIFKTCIVATMSCGKSTFINSIIGDEILPEKNEACTARTMAVIDNDGAVEKKAHIIYKDGTADIKYITNRQTLEDINNDENVIDFLVETDIVNIKNSSKALVLIDTPGVNNSEDERHGQRTEELLKQMQEGLIIYLLNATQLATNDDALLLQMISDHVKKNPGIHIFFVINKIDALDLEQESIRSTVIKVRDYIEDHGIKNPIIYPVSALSAKILRMAYYHKEMTRREKRKLEEVYEDYKPRENSMLSYAMVDVSSDEMYEIGDDEISGQELLRAIENTGIIAIEKKIEEIMLTTEEHYTPEVIIKSTINEKLLQKNQDRIREISRTLALDNYGSFYDLKNKVNHSIALKQINKSVKNGDTLIKNVEKEVDKGNAFDLLLNDIEILKSRIYQVFNEYYFVWISPSENRYIIPADKEDTCISAKTFYFISEDKMNWNVVNFKFLTQNVEGGKEIYVYNSITQFLGVISSDNCTEIIAMLDVKLPFTIIELGKMEKSLVCSIDDAIEYVDEADALYAQRMEEIRTREEKAGRIYKGIEFPTIEEKDRAISMEKEVQEFCLNASKQSHQVLWDKKEELSTLPHAIFSPYIAQLVSIMDRVENKEIQEYINRISIADLEEIYKLESEINLQHYTQSSQDKLRAALDQAIQRGQSDVLSHMVEKMAEMSREELYQLLNRIKEKDFPSEVLSPYIRKIENQYDIREQQELEDLCKGLERKNIEELQELEQAILSGNYQEKFYESYEIQIEKRIDYLYMLELEEICSRLEEVDREELQQIRKKVEFLPCKDYLKKDSLSRIEKQSEILDLRALNDLTSDLENKSLNECQAVMEELQNGNYNKKYVNEYLMKTRVFMEKAEKEQLDHMIAGIDSANKAEVERLESGILNLHYPERVNILALKRIYKRKFVLDVLELLQLSNDFDRLSEKEISKIRMICEQKNVMEESRDFYYKKLDEREFNVIFQRIRPYSVRMKQIIEQQYVQFPGMYVAEYTEDYLQEVDVFRICCDAKNNYELPVFILNSDIYLAITLNSLYTRVNNVYTRFDLQEIQSIISIKRFLFEGLALNLKDGRNVGISGTVNKKVISTLVGILNDMLHTIVNHDTAMSYDPIILHVEGYSMKDITDAIEDYEDSEDNVILRFITNYFGQQGQLGSSGSFHYIGEEKWENNEKKAITNMGIENEDSIIFYFDNTIFGSAKEGFAVGRRFIYIKKSGQSLITMPIADIAQVRKRDSTEKIEIITKDSTIVIVDNIMVKDAEALAELLEGYVFDVQLFIGMNLS